MIEFVEVDVDGQSVRIGLQVERNRSGEPGAATQWLATTRLPGWTTPRADIAIRGVGRDRGSAVADAVSRLTEAIARYEPARRQQAKGRLFSP